MSLSRRGLVWLSAISVVGFVMVKEVPPLLRGTSWLNAPHPGKAEFDRYCRACHNPTKLSAILSRHAEEQRRAILIGFLAHHGASPPRADELIADYLMTVPE